MKLYDLKNIIDFTFDLMDDEVSASFYIELDEINEKYAKEIEVVKIGEKYVTCKLTKFIRKHKTAVAKYIQNNYYDSELKYYLMIVFTDNKDVLTDGGEAVYHFITNDLCDFLKQ